MNVQAGMAYQAGVPACLRPDARYQRPATAGVPIRGRLPGHFTSKHRTITLAQASKVRLFGANQHATSSWGEVNHYLCSLHSLAMTSHGASCMQAAEASSAESPQALALYLEGQSMVKEMAERPLVTHSWPQGIESCCCCCCCCCRVDRSA